MVYKFRLLSDEVDDFRRDIEIDSDATFFELHKAILESVNYPDDQMTSFFICNDNWVKLVEITREDMGGMSEDENYVMEDTVIGDVIGAGGANIRALMASTGTQIDIDDDGVVRISGTDEAGMHAAKVAVMA